jgi:hypothetical protein
MKLKIKAMIIAATLAITSTAPITTAFADQATEPSLGVTQAISIGQYQTCAIENTGYLKCWGPDWLAVPPDLGKVIAVSAAVTHTCAITISHDLRCWGGPNWYGQTTVPSNLGKVIKVATYGFATCGLKVDHTAFCLGRVDSENLGVPIYLGQVRDISLGNAACVIKMDFLLTCWQGISQAYWPSWLPTENSPHANPVSNVVSAFLGGGGYCAIGKDGALISGSACWPIGNISSADVGPIKSVAVGSGSFCVLTISSKVKCYDTERNQAENRYIYRWSTEPDIFATEISSYGNGFCATTTSGDIVCWGDRWQYTDRIPSAGFKVAPLALSTTSIPVISGESKVGRSLVAVSGTWDSSASLAYQWLRDGVEIGGSTSSLYSLSLEDYQHQISVRVTGSAPGYETRSEVSAAVAVGKGSLPSAPTPTISGDVKVGSTIAAVSGTWGAAASLSYKWLRDGLAIENATSSSYLLTSADYGHQVSVAVTGQSYGYESSTQTSLAETVTAGTFSMSARPEFSGISKVGSRLQASSGDFSPAGYVSYQWLRDGNQIDGATSDSYVLTASDYQHSVAVEVTVGLAGFETRTETSDSALVGRGAFAQTPSLSVEGSASIGSTVDAKVSNLAEGTSVSYQWLLDGQVINSATESTYLVSANDFNHTISFKAVVAKSGYESIELTSPATTPVKKSFFGLIAPDLKGQFAAGRNVSAVVTSMGSGVSYTYQWLRDGVPIEGAITRKYVLTASDANKTVAFRVCGSKLLFETACLVSNSNIVALGDLNPKPVPVFKWTSVKVGAIMQGRPGTWDSGVSLSYSWLRDGLEIAGENDITYRLTAADRGHSINFKVVAQKFGYNSVIRTSLSKFIP